MTQPSRFAAVQKSHAALWYDVPSYRFAWVILPQAVVALVMGLFFLGAGPVVAPVGGTDQAAKTEWAKPADMDETIAELNKIRDAVGDNSDPSGLVLLETMGDQGNLLARFKLGTLYDPLFAGRFPYPVQKDARRALALYQPAYEDGFWLASWTIADLRLARDTPQYDPVIGCQAARAHIEAPEMAPDKWDETNNGAVLNAAECYAGIFNPDATGPMPIADEDARKALTLYDDPSMADFALTYYGKAFLYLNWQASVYDVTKGCAAARKFVDMTAAYPETYTSQMSWVLGEAAYCILGTDGRRSTAQYQPTIQNEQAALNLFSLPIMADVPFAQGGLGWFYLNETHALNSPQKGCDIAQHWASLTKGDPVENDLLSGWTATNFARCLLAIDPSTSPLEPTAEQRDVAVGLLENFAAKNDTTAQLELGRLFDFGMSGIAKDQPRALSLFQTCSALGEPLCTAGVADYKKYGLGGLSVDREGALAEYRKCALAGVASCHAQIVSTQLADTAPEDLPAAETLGHLQTAMEGGHSLGTSMYAVALYDGNYGLKADAAASAVMFIKSFAAEGGDPTYQFFKENYAPVVDKPAFWQAFYTELKRRGVYDGKITSKMSTKGLKAAEQLVR